MQFRKNTYDIFVYSEFYYIATLTHLAFGYDERKLIVGLTILLFGNKMVLATNKHYKNR